MVDSNVIKALFTLLRSGLWNKPTDDLSCFPLEIAEWKCLYDIAIAQTVDGIVYDGIQRLPKAFFPPREILLKWVVRINYIESSNSTMNACIEEQVVFFDKINVKPILLKGQGIARYYPNPKHRVCGDIDWFFASDKESKLVENKLKANNIKIHSDTTASTNYLWRKCLVENHTKLFDVFNPIARYKLENIRKQLPAVNGCIDGGIVYNSLPPNLNILQVNLHILKHLLSFGIGLRQFCDSAILYAHLDGKYNKDWLYAKYNELGIINWTHVLHDLLVNYIGLPEKNLPFSIKDDSSSTWMVNDTLSTGNFGFYDNTYTIMKKDNTIQRKNKSKKLLYSFQQYFHLAPYEAISFPIVHFLERFKSITIG